MMNVGYLGPRGTFTEEAAARLFPQEPPEPAALIPYRTIPEVLADVEAVQIALAVFGLIAMVMMFGALYR